VKASFEAVADHHDRRTLNVTSTHKVHTWFLTEESRPLSLRLVIMDGVDAD
jgi:hypothetical protein